MFLRYPVKFLISLFGFCIKALVEKPPGIGKPERIAILLWGGIGNHILFSPALYAIRKRFPNSLITICSFQHFAEELFPQTADRFLTVGENPSLRSIHRMLFLLKQYRPDVVISNGMSPTFLSSSIAYLSGARIRVGVDRCHRGSLNNIRMREDACHEVELNRRIAESLTRKPVEPILCLDYATVDEKIANNMAMEIFGMTRHGVRVAVQPGSGSRQAFKRWEKEKFKSLIERLLHIGAKVVVMGTEEEQEEIAFIRKTIRHKDLKFLRTHLTLPQIALVLKHFDLVVANDTSLVHLAAASGVPSVVIYGPTDPDKNEPWGVSSRIVRKRMKCAPCYQYAIPRCRRHFKCLRDISVEEVFNAVKELREEKKPQISHLDIDRLLDSQSNWE
jgi:ADP-heptose:LPS heptosyltransferase